MKNCWTKSTILRISIISLNILLLLSTIPIVYQFINNYIRSPKKPPKKLFYPALFFLIVTFTVLSTNLFLLLTDCVDGILPFIGEIIHVSVYLMQNCLVLFISFIRLYIVFNNTLFQLSTITIRIFVTVYIMLPFLCILNAVSYAINPDIGMIMGALLFAVLLIFIIATFILFVGKLVAVYKNVSDHVKNQDLIDTITKLSILTIIPISVTVILIFSSFATSYIHNKVVSGTILTLLMLSDIYTNFCCIILSYGCFLCYYNILCKCTHNKCVGICSKIFNVETKLTSMINVHSTESVHANSNQSVHGNSSIQV